VVPKPT